MAKVRLTVEDKRDIFLYSTEIENLFISEFLPDAPGDYVKVYLFGLMYARYGQPIDTHKLARRLELSENEIEEAWIYWESRGLVKTVSADGAADEEKSLVFVSQVEALYGKAPEPAAPLSAPEEEEPEDVLDEEDLQYINIDDMDFDEVLTDRLVDKRLPALYEKYQMTTGRTVSRQEVSKIEDAVKVYGIEPEILDFAIDYCADLQKYSIDYIFKVALRWTEEGCRTIEDAKKLLDKHNLRNSWYRQVFKALGFNRLPAPADREIMDRWFDDMQCSINEVLDACAASAGLRDPNLRYVNKVIENRRAEKGGINTKAGSGEPKQTAAAGAAQAEASPVSRKVLADYYEYIRAQGEKEQQARRAEVLQKLPEMRAVFDKESSLNSRMLSIRPGSADLDARQRLRVERLATEEQKKVILTENGYPADYLERRYLCDICRDTGYTDEGMVCSCCRQRAKEAYKWHTDKEKA